MVSLSLALSRLFTNRQSFPVFRQFHRDVCRHFKRSGYSNPDNSPLHLGHLHRHGLHTQSMSKTLEVSMLCGRSQCALLHRYSGLLYDRSRIPSSTVPSVRVLQRRPISSETYQKYFSSEFFPIGLAQSLLENVHTMTGSPWWLTIATVTVGLRLVTTLPLAIFNARNMAKTELVRNHLFVVAGQLKEKLKEEKFKYNWTDTQAQIVFKRKMNLLTRQLYEKNNCHPLRPFVFTIGQLALWFSMSFALRNLSGTPILGLETQLLCPEMAIEGALWFPSLLIPDTTLIIPLLVGVTQLINTEISFLSPKKLPTHQTLFLYLMRAACVYMCFISAYVPTCLSFYWLCSALFGLTQNCLFRVSMVKQFLGLPVKVLRKEVGKGTGAEMKEKKP